MLFYWVWVAEAPAAAAVPGQGAAGLPPGPDVADAQKIAATGQTPPGFH